MHNTRNTNRHARTEARTEANPNPPRATSPTPATPGVPAPPPDDTFAQTTLGSMYPLRLAGDDAPPPARPGPAAPGRSPRPGPN
ncbi:MAG: hypothetical protein AAF356_11185 [Planctomycetota bacterium]